MTPIARAILSRSVEDLDRVLALDPDAAVERSHDLTTLELCATWPEGLQRLLTTRARDLIDVGAERAQFSNLYQATPLRRALAVGTADSVNLLMKADCALDLGPGLGDRFVWKAACAKAVASNLADRRRRLLRLCQQELGLYLDWDPASVPDEHAGAMYATLARVSIPVPRHLSVPPDYLSIFHWPGHFGVFQDHGFRGFWSHNQMGLTSLMVLRNHELFGEDVRAMWSWAQAEGLLDQTQQDPLHLGLNTSSTGLRYMAVALAFSNMLQLDATRLPFNVVKYFFQATVRDRCVCWCAPPGSGCSPLRSLWKAWTDLRNPIGRGDQIWRHFLFHHHHRHESECGPSQRTTDGPNFILSMALEVVRLVTFEALDMTHTRCRLEKVENLPGAQQPPLGSPRATTGPPRYRLVPRVIVNCPPKLADEIRADGLEQQNARLLDELMQEFEPQIRTLDVSDPTSLGRFLRGPWRRRISPLFAIDESLVSEMGELLHDVTVTRKKHPKSNLK